MRSAFFVACALLASATSQTTAGPITVAPAHEFGCSQEKAEADKERDSCWVFATAVDTQTSEIFECRSELRRVRELSTEISSLLTSVCTSKGRAIGTSGDFDFVEQDVTSTSDVTNTVGRWYVWVFDKFRRKASICVTVNGFPFKCADTTFQ
jgi:hypothetical protein